MESWCGPPVPEIVIINGARVSIESPKADFPEAALWGVTRANVKYWRGELLDWDEWWDLHPIDPNGWFRGIPERRPEAWAWYQQEPAGARPIWMHRHDPRVPASRRFPATELQAHFGIREYAEVVRERQGGPAAPRHPSKHFTCQVDFMIAAAIVRGARCIVLNGIGVNTKASHQFGHRGILYWIGAARLAGVEVLVKRPSIYQNPAKVYGYERGADILGDPKLRYP